MQWLLVLCTVFSWSIASTVAVPPPIAKGVTADATQVIDTSHIVKRGETVGEPGYAEDGTINYLAWYENNVRDGYIHVDYYASLAQDGTAHLWTRFRNANDVFEQDYAFVCGLRDTAGHGFSMSREGSLGARKSTTFQQDVPSPYLAQYWNDIVNGNMVMACEVKGSFDLPGLLEQVLDIIKTYGPTIGEIIALL